MTRWRSRLITSLAILLTLTLTACIDGARPRTHQPDSHQSGEPQSGEQGSDSSDPADLADTLRSHGITIVASAADLDSVAEAPYGVSLTQSQVANMSRQLGGHGGLWGSELDQLIPMPDSSPPFSYLLGAWLDLAETPRARTAAQWFPEDTNWRLSPRVLFPASVLPLFLADNAEAAMKDLPAPPQVWPTGHGGGSGVTGARSVALRAADPLATPCSSVAEFFNTSLTSLFNALRLDPKGVGSGAIQAVSGFVAGLWNHAVSLAEGVVRGLVKTLTQDALEALAEAMAIAQVVLQVSTYIFGWTVQVSSSHDPLVMPGGSGPAVDGRWRVVPDQRYVDFDGPIKNCVKTLPGNHKLLSIFEPGTPVTWRVLPDGFDPLAPPQVAFASYSALSQVQKVPASGNISVPFTSGIEPQQKADPATGWANVEVAIPRAEIRALYEATESMLRSMIDSIASQPAFVTLQLDGFLRETLTGWLKPLLTRLQGAFGNAVGQMFTVRGYGTTTVSYHPWTPPEGPEFAPCFVGRWAMQRTPKGFGVEQSWESWTFDITQDRFDMSVHLWQNRVKGLSGWTSSWTGGTPMKVYGRWVGDDFAVELPSRRMRSSDHGGSWQLPGTQLGSEADYATDIAFAVQFAPKKLTCIDDNHLQVRSIVDRIYPFSYRLRRI